MPVRFNNTWVNVWLNQMWICRQVTDVVAKTMDSDLWLDPQALTGRGLRPSEPRLNPLEFHGKRRSPPPRATPRNERQPLTPRLQEHQETC